MFELPPGTRRKRQRPTIGYILNNPLLHSDTYIREVWEGLADGAEAADVNLICYCGTKVLNDPRPLLQNTALFSQANPEWLDGFIAVSHLDPAFAELIPALGRTPTVSLQPSKFPNVSVDNRAGMRAALEHLLDVHGRRRLAFLRGEPGEPSCEERYRTYQELLRERHIPLDPALLLQGDNWDRSGEKAVATLIDERNVDFDAVVCANDAMALGVLAALNRRGFVFPGPVSVTGFDDFPRSALSRPPLTTVRQPMREMAFRTVGMVVSAMRGTPPENVVLPAKLVVRTSCGCPSEAIVDAGAIAQVRRGWLGRPRRKRTLVQVRMEIAADARARLGGIVKGLGDDWPIPLLHALAVDLDRGDSRSSLEAVEHLTAGLVAADEPAAAAHKVLSALRTACLPWLSDDPERLARAESIWQQARMVIQLEGDRQVADWNSTRDAHDAALRDLVRSLAGMTQVSAVTGAVVKSLKVLGIRSAYVAVHESEEHPIERSRLVMAYRDDHPVPLPAEGVRMRTREILPAGFEPAATERFSWMVVPIFLNFEENDQIGYAVFAVDRGHGEVCQALGEQLGSPLKGAFVLEALERDVAERRASEEQLNRELEAFLAVVHAASEGDLTRRGTASQETLAKISSSVNGMFEQFSKILADVRRAAQQVTRSSSEILSAATEIAAGAEHSSDQVHTSTSAVEEMAHSMDEVWRHADDSAQRARQVLEHVRHSDGSVEAAHDAMSRIDQAVQGTAEKMRLLESRTAEISDVIGVIESIAKRSKLLALNASIAAAQAGEAGRGFAVVADEVGHLAESSTAAVTEVARRVEGIVKDTQPAIASLEHAMHQVEEGRAVSEQARASLREISSLVQVSAQFSTQIAAASREQAQAAKLVASAMQAVSSDGLRSSTNARETSALVRGLVSLAEELDRAVSRFRTNGASGGERALAPTQPNPRSS